MYFRRLIAVAAVSAALGAITACGGSGSSPATPPVRSAPGAALAATTISIVVPAVAGASPAASRRPQFVSPSTNGASIAAFVSPRSANPVPVSSAAVDLSAGSRACVAGSAGARTCTVQFGLSGGTYDVAIATYDRAPVNGAFAGANELGSATLAAITIVPGVANAVNVALGGLVASVVLGPAGLSIDGSAPSTTPLAFTALDADGNTIVAGTTTVTNAGVASTDTFATPIVIAAVETGSTGHAKFSVDGAAPASSVTLLRSSDTLALVYDGKAGGGTYGLSVMATASSAPGFTLPVGIVPATVTVPLAIQQLPMQGGAGQGTHLPLVTVSVGGGPAVPLLLDTGSSGLRIFADKAGTFTSTGTPNQLSTAAGVTYFGTVATANVTVGGLAFPAPVPVQIVSSVCPTGTGNPLFDGFCGNGMPSETPLIEAGGTYGVLGVRADAPSAANGVYSPLGHLAFNLGRGFIVSLGDGTAPSLTFGLTKANLAGFATTTALGSTAFPDGTPAFATSDVPFCYRFTGPGAPNPQPSACLPNTGPIPGALSDTGDPALNLRFAQKNPGSIETAGYPIVATVPGSSLTWTFTLAAKGATACQSWDAGKITFGSKDPTAQTQGALPFYRNDVLFDPKDGLFGYRPENTARPSFCP